MPAKKTFSSIRVRGPVRFDSDFTLKGLGVDWPPPVAKSITLPLYDFFNYDSSYPILGDYLLDSRGSQGIDSRAWLTSSATCSSSSGRSFPTGKLI